MRRLAILMPLLLMVTACGDDSNNESTPVNPPSPTSTALEEAGEACGDLNVGNPLDPDNQQPASSYITVEDEGRTLLIDGGDQFSTPPAGFCVLEELDAPAGTTSKVEGTTALMGQLTDEFGEYELTWSFHPDSGLNMIVETSS